MSRGAVWIAAWFVVGGSLGVGGPQQPSVSAERAAVNRYCVGCHNQSVKTGGLALDNISTENVNQHPEVWEKVVRKLRARYMPPVGVPRPDERTYDALVA